MNETHLGDALHAYLDNELTVERALEARSHLNSCSSCRRELSHMRQLHEVLQRSLVPSEPSVAFLRTLRQSVRQADPGRWRGRLARAAWATGPLAAAVLLVLFALQPTRPPSSDMTGEVVATHLRSLQAGHLTDVASSDRHTVKPWFQGRLPFSPPVLDFSGQGFTLLGGRLDYVGSQEVAALVYRSGQHTINALVWPAPAERDVAPRAETRAGFHALHWVSDGMAWWLVSDIGEADLQQLASLLRTPQR
jgi:anti-sigma factor RsiW